MSTAAHFSIADYNRMIAAGVFEPREEHQVELIRGELHEMNPINPPHSEVVNLLMYWSIDHCPRDQVRVRSQDSLGLPALESVPQPDVFWVKARDYSRERPTNEDVFLVIEVAESSLAYDRGEKAQLYAKAGIQDYWVINVNDRVVEVFRDPAGGHYRQLQTFKVGDTVSPLAFPDLQLAVADLWPA
ncbi:MAG: Uma2 family endonuclease [Pirellulales bacterium]|nr:Uma2 family endonuclease [Pirellulales bacterium]